MASDTKSHSHLIVHTVAGLHPRTGGPARTVTQLTAALAADSTYRVVLLSQGIRGENIVPISEQGLDWRIGRADHKIVLNSGYPLKSLLHRLIIVDRPSILHDNGIWLPSNHHVAAAARQYGIPRVINPHGMLQPWALHYRGWKKRLALSLYQRRDLDTVTLFFANANQEAESIRRLGLKQPIAVIPNGIEVIQYRSNGCGMSRAGSSDRIALFLSRIHPSKGIVNLIEAWGRLRPPGWRLRLAGPDEGGHLAEVLQKVKALRLMDSVEYVGEVEGETKDAMYEEADLFILPSFSESFGVVVAEALAHGLPVITTRGTPWSELPLNGCGWWIDLTVDSLSETIRKATSMDQTTLTAMGKKGQALARKFEWSTIAQQTIKVYRWILGQGAKPDYVLID